MSYVLALLSVLTLVRMTFDLANLPKSEVTAAGITTYVMNPWGVAITVFIAIFALIVSTVTVVKSSQVTNTINGGFK